MKRLIGGVFAALLCGASAQAADVSAWTTAHQKDILGQFETMLAMKNVASNVADIEANAAYLQDQLKARGFTSKLLSAGPGTPPAVFGELKVKGAKRTVVFYAHYDGQPAEQDGWRTSPWKPVVRTAGAAGDQAEVDWRAAPTLDPVWRIYGRSASDDKAPIQAMLSALDALKAQGRKPTINVKIFWEGEEEAGSDNLDAILAANKDLLKGDLFVLSDGPIHQSGRPTLYFGARGVAGLNLTTYGPIRPLHSGHYGNWAPNPSVEMAWLIASLRDEEGRILVTGFYDDMRPLTPTEKAALAAMPDVESGLKRELLLGRTEGGERLLDSISRPALNVRGLRGGGVGGEAANVILPQAQASIDFRLVPDQTPEHVRDKVEAYLRAKGWYIVHDAPKPEELLAHPKIVRADWSLNYAAYRTDMDMPQARAVAKALAAAHPGDVLRIPMLGGSVPMV
ncbi:MAG: M20/M25/M40 family metallo-hydrolase, partial [Caulobacteraceae bacterium]